jgi:hypothetical protein
MTIEEAQRDRLAWIEKKNSDMEFYDSIGETDLRDRSAKSIARFTSMSNEDFIKFVESQRAFVPKMRSGLLPV